MTIDAASKTVRVTVRNAGRFSVRRGSSVRLESFFLNQRRERLGKSVGLLPPGGSNTVVFQLREVSRRMQFTATADVGNAVLETNERNNTMTKSLR